MAHNGGFMKDIVITGACGGMGRAASLAFRDAGFRVFAIDLKPLSGEENIIPVEADITSEAAVAAAFERVKEHTDSVDSVIHFAGVYMLDSLVEMPPEKFRKIFDVNLYGAYLVNRAFLPLLSSGSKIIITTSELAPLAPLPFTGIYAVTKAALDKYAYSLRMELQLLGITVSVLRAGAVKTEMFGASTDALDAFVEGTKLYSCNAKRFKAIVEKVEARSVSPDKIASKVLAIHRKRNPRFAYKVNRNPLLLLLNMLPYRLQLFAIRRILR